MKCVVLCGGLGTRLRKVANDTPKPMALIASKPFLEYLVLQLHAEGFHKLVFCTGYLGEQIQNYFGNGSRWGLHIAYSQEPEPLGTGGAIRHAASFLQDEDFLVMNGDSFLDIDLRSLTAFHKANNALATLALMQVEDATRFGRVRVDSDSQILAFLEKGTQGPGLINGGVYVFNKKILNYIPEGKVSLEFEVFPGLIGQGFYGMPVDGYFTDIGTPESLKRLQENPDKLLAAVEHQATFGGRRVNSRTSPS